MIIARSPLRITLGGGGTDLPFYCSKFGGIAVGATIDRYVWVTVRTAPLSSELEVHTPMDGTTFGLSAVQDRLVREALSAVGLHQKPFAIHSCGDVPSGTGLGSSAAFLVSLVTAAEAHRGSRMSRGSSAERAFEIESVKAARPVGRQDPYLSAVGGFNTLEISKRGLVRVVPMRVSPKTIQILNRRLLLFYTGKRRDAATQLEPQRHLTDRESALHAIKEIGLGMRSAIEKGDLTAFGSLLKEHWTVKREAQPLSTDSEIDKLYAEALRLGAEGGKIIGAGGGGFLAVYVPDAHIENVRRCMHSRGLPELHYAFEFEGASAATI